MGISVSSDIESRLVDLYWKAKKEGRVGIGKYGRDSFAYVEIDSKEFPPGVPRQKIAFSLYIANDHERQTARFEREYGDATTYKRLVREHKFLIFVFRDQVPQEFREIGAAHEYVEGYTENHANGQKAQFDEALMRGNDFFERYVRWFAGNCSKPKDENSRRIFLEDIVPKGAIPILQEEEYI